MRSVSSIDDFCSFSERIKKVFFTCKYLLLIRTKKLPNLQRLFYKREHLVRISFRFLTAIGFSLCYNISQHFSASAHENISSFY